MIDRLLSEYQNLLDEAGYGKIQTSVKPLEKFYKAETYHQDYLKKTQMDTAQTSQQVWFLIKRLKTPSTIKIYFQEKKY